MCGILGQVSPGAPIDPGRFERMLSTLAQRGPDGRGLRLFDDGRAALGHTRLSIIDLSSTGAQPMSNEDGSLWLTFNGEIYNFRALRSELEHCGHRFRSRADSEVVLHAYEEWGPACLNRLRGIFAFGIYDGRDRSLFMARDHVGVKPLYYQAGADSFIFASVPRAILASRDGKPAVDAKALSLYLAYGNVPGEHCIYSGIHKLPPGHWLRYRDGHIESRRYWELRYRPVIRDPDAAAAAVRKKIEECVPLQSVSDVPIGTLLSGGVDSTIVTALLAPVDAAGLSSYTIGFDDAQSDERRYARIVAEGFGTQHREGRLDFSSGCTLLPGIVDAFDEPFHLNGLFPYFALSRLVQSGGNKVVLGGDGGDELFAGYLWYERFGEECRGRRGASLWSRLLRRPGKMHDTAAAASLERFLRYNSKLDWPAQRRLAGREMPALDGAALSQPFQPHWHPEFPPVLAAQFVDFHGFLVDHCLTKVDRASMAFGVEVRVPLLDVELVERVFSVDHAITFRAGERKALLKSAMGHLFPARMDPGRKKGFSSPVASWLEQGLATAGSTLLADGGLCTHGYLDPAALRRHYPRLSRDNQLLLISGELWFRRWVEGDRGAAQAFADMGRTPSKARAVTVAC